MKLNLTVFRILLGLMFLCAPVQGNNASGNLTDQQKAQMKLFAEGIFLELYETFTRTLPAKTYFEFKEAILNSQKKMGALGTNVYEDGGKSLEEVDKIREKLHSDLKKILTEKTFKRYLEYEVTLGARNRLIQMKRQGFIVPDEKMRESLIMAMAQVDQALRVPSTPREQMEFFKDGMNETTAQKVIDLNKEATKAYISASEKILPFQLAKGFKEGLERAARFLELGLKHQATETAKAKAKK